MNERSAFTERRKAPQTAEHFADCQNAIRQHFDERFDSLEQTLQSAFPNGDLEGHRRAHEEVIATIADRTALWKAVREKTVSGGVYAALGLLMMALWEYAKAHLASPK